MVDILQTSLSLRDHLRSNFLRGIPLTATTLRDVLTDWVTRNGDQATISKLCQILSFNKLDAAAGKPIRLPPFNDISRNVTKIGILRA